MKVNLMFRQRRASKSHRCMGCGAKIRKGSTYTRVVSAKRHFSFIKESQSPMGAYCDEKCVERAKAHNADKE